LTPTRQKWTHYGVLNFDELPRRTLQVFLTGIERTTWRYSNLLTGNNETGCPQAVEGIRRIRVIGLPNNSDCAGGAV
jgi:hypothetical protein